MRNYYRNIQTVVSQVLIILFPRLKAHVLDIDKYAVWLLQGFSGRGSWREGNGGGQRKGIGTELAGSPLDNENQQDQDD